MYDIDHIRWEGRRIIQDYSDSGGRWGVIPVASSLALTPLIISMIQKINKMAGIDGSKAFADYVFGAFAVHMLATPLASIPLLGIAVVRAAIETIGQDYLSAVIYAAEKANSNFGPIKQLLKDALKDGDYPKYKFV